MWVISVAESLASRFQSQPVPLLCVFFPVYAYVSFCLDYEEIYLFFVIVLLGCAINHVFLHNVNILWILLFKNDDIGKSR